MLAAEKLRRSYKVEKRKGTLKMAKGTWHMAKKKSHFEDRQRGMMTEKLNAPRNKIIQKQSNKP